jgi:hypothetical protein
VYKIEATYGGRNMIPKKASPPVMIFEISTLQLTCLQRLIKENYMVEIKACTIFIEVSKGLRLLGVYRLRWK